MSDAVSALAGATYEGFCSVSDGGLVGMVTLRGDLASKEVQAAVKKATGCAVPERGAILARGAARVAWMSLDELMLFGPYEEAAEMAKAMAQALPGAHALVADVSDARVVLRVEGPAVREVMAKLTPADVSPEGFGPGQMRRTRLQQVPAAFFMPDETSFEVIAFRSVADYVFGLLENAAKPGGEVGIFEGG